MTEIPLGFSFDPTDDGFVLRNKTDDGIVTEIKVQLNRFRASRQKSTFGRIVGCQPSG